MSALPRLHLTASPWVVDVLSHLWQSTAVAFAILLLLVACRRISARTRRTLGWIALAKFALPVAGLVQLAQQLAGTPQGWLAQDAGLLPVHLAGDTLEAASPATTWVAPAWLWPVLTGIWLLGVAALLARWLARGIRVRRQLLAGTGPVPAAVELAVANAAVQVGLRAAPRCVEVGRNHGPGVVGLVSPILVLPRGLATTLSPAERDAILIHECVHLQRHDNLWGAVRAAFVGLLWFNPIAWLLSRSIAIETEKSCDERVLEITGDAETYARSIVASVRHTLGLVQPGFAGATTPPVLARIKNILACPARPDRPTARWTALAVAIVLVMFSGRAGSIAAGSGPVPGIGAAPERAAPPSLSPATPAPTLSVDFPDEDIRAIIRNVADLFQLNVIMPDTLKGKMTIKLRDATWRQIFQIVLEPTGFTFVEEENIIRIFHRDSPPGPATRKIGTITITFAGAAGTTEQAVRAAMQLRDGGEFNETTLDHDVRAIYRLGHFKTVEVKHARVNGSTYDLFFELAPKDPAQPPQLEESDPSRAALGSVEEELVVAKRRIAEANESLGELRAERAAMLAKQKESDDALAREAASRNPPATLPPVAPVAPADGREQRDLRPPLATAPTPAPARLPVETPADAPLPLSADAPAVHQGMRVHDISELDQKPVARFQARPQYPHLMRRSGIRGEAVIDFIVDTNGDVQRAFAIRSSRAEFEAPAVVAVSKWRFKPGQKGGRDVPTHMQVPIIFTLNER